MKNLRSMKVTQGAEKAPNRSMYYGIIRFVAEFLREPDPFIGLLIFNFSMGQLLSIPLVCLGIALLVFSMIKR